MATRAALENKELAMEPDALSSHEDVRSGENIRLSLLCHEAAADDDTSGPGGSARRPCRFSD